MTTARSGVQSVHRAFDLLEVVVERGGSATIGKSGLDEDMEAIRSEMRRFGLAEVVPHAHEWHSQNAYIPMEIVTKMAELGVDALVKAIRGEEVASLIDSGAALVTKDNMGEFQ